MSERASRVLFFASAVTLALAIAWLSEAARSGGAPSTVVVGLAFAFIPYGAAVASCAWLRGSSLRTWIPIALAFVVGVPFLFAPPLLSDDVYRYLWEGRLWLEGSNPYRFPPDDPALAHLRDDIWERINNKPLATIYPPISQLWFATAAWLGGGLFTFKLLALGGHALTVGVVARLVDAPRAALALALNPLLLAESALNGHFDLLCGLAILVAARAAGRDRWSIASLATQIAVGLKVVGLVLLPLLRWRPKALLGAVAGSALFLAPLAIWRGPLHPASGAGQYAARWRGNESLFALVELACRWLVDEGRAAAVARITVALVLILVCAWVARRRLSSVTAARGLVWSVLLLSPQVHPWYLGWLLPLEVAAGGVAGLVWSAAVLCAYAPLDLWLSDGVWRMPLWLQVFEYAVLAAALWADPQRAALREHAARQPVPS